jgi:DNA-binding beta-propeller fold protein YncE
MIDRRELIRTLGLGLVSFQPAKTAAEVTFPTTIVSVVERAFRAPHPLPNGLQATQEGLWILDQGTNRVALVRFRDGQVVRQFDTETDRGSGITFDGSALWIASTYNRLLVKVDSQNGKTLGKFSSPGSGVVKWGPRSDHPTPTGAHGMEFLRGELWVAVPPSATIYVMNSEDGSILRSFAAPGVRPHGIGWDPDGSLWCAESNYRSFFKMAPRTGQILKQLMLPPASPEVDGLVITPHGMTVWEKQIWFCVAETGEVYRFPIPP